MTAWITIFAAGLVSFGLRAVPARWAGRHELPAHWQPRLALLGPAAFAALAAPAVVLGPGPDGSAVAGLAAGRGRRSRRPSHPFDRGHPGRGDACAVAGHRPDRRLKGTPHADDPHR